MSKPKLLPYEYEYDSHTMIRFDTEEGFVTRLMIETYIIDEFFDVTDLYSKEYPADFMRLRDKVQEYWDRLESA